MPYHATGPRSDAGKERSSLNAVKHGLRSERPVLPGEDAAEWDGFHAGVVEDLGPATALERELADRIALQLWRLRRAARYEAQVAADEGERARAAATDPLLGPSADQPAERALAEAAHRLLEEKNALLFAEAVRDVARRLPTLPAATRLAPEVARALLLLVGVVTPDRAPGSAAALRRELATAAGRAVSEALVLTARLAEERCRDAAATAARGALRVERLRRDLAREGEARQHDSRLLQTAALERVVRYEAHVSRQLNQALQLLRAFKAERRAGEEGAPPASSATLSDPVGSAVPEAAAQEQPRRKDQPTGRGEGGSEICPPKEVCPVALRPSPRTTSVPARPAAIWAGSFGSPAATVGGPFVRQGSPLPPGVASGGSGTRNVNKTARNESRVTPS
jgi:hypothetical protein